MVPYSGNHGHKLLSKMKNQLKKTLPDDVNTMISYKSTKLSTKFPVEDKTDFQHKNDVFYIIANAEVKDVMKTILGKRIDVL